MRNRRWYLAVHDRNGSGGPRWWVATRLLWVVCFLAQRNKGQGTLQIIRPHDETPAERHQLLQALSHVSRPQPSV
jgi:hypothetical protein